MRPDGAGSISNAESVPAESLNRGAGSFRSLIRIFAVVLLAFVGGALVSVATFGVLEASAFFPPAGLTVAAMLLTGRSRWPAIAAAIVLGELLVDLFHGLDLPMASVYAGTNVLEPVIGASLVLAWCGGTPDLRRTRDLTLFVIGAVLIGPLIAGVISGWLSAWLTGSSWSAAGLQLFAGDGIAVLVIGAPILLWPKQSYIITSRPLESAATLVAATVLSVIGFTYQLPPSITVLPVLAWTALRLGMIGTALAGAVVATVGNLSTGTNHGLIAAMDASEPVKVSVSQAYVTVMVLTALLIAQEVSKRTTAVAERDVERGERRRMESLSALAQEFSAAHTPLEVSRALERQLFDGVGASALCLGLLNDQGGQLVWVATAGAATTESRGLGLDEKWVATDVLRSGEPILIRTADECASRYPDAERWFQDAGIQSAAGWPLLSGGERVGVLALGWPRPQDFDPEQQAYLSTVASMIGQALTRAQSYVDEHARAMVLHSALHPAGHVDAVGLQYDVFYDPSDSVHGLGGDWYDVLPLPGSRTYFAVGDIVGHGMTAVEDMAQLRSAGRAFANQGLAPATLLAELNGFADRVSRGEFATAVVAVFDHRAGSLAYCSAGHPPPVLRRADGEVILLADANGPALGPIADAGFPPGHVEVNPGDVLLMYTDGLVEHQGQVVSNGIDRLARLVRDWPAEGLLDCKAITEKLAPPPRTDDVCLLAVRFD